MASKTKPAPAAAAKAATPKAIAKPLPGIPSANQILSCVAAAQKAQPHAEYIYVNANGEYHLHKREGFHKVDMSDGELVIDKIRTDRPVKLSNAAKPAAPTVEETETGEDDEPAAPTDGEEF